MMTKSKDDLEERISIAREMLMDRCPVEKVVQYSKLDAKKVLQLQEELSTSKACTLSIDEIVKAIVPIANKYGVSKVYLFGSYAKECATSLSDIDLLIEKGKIRSLLQLVGFRQDVEDTLGKSVDIVTTDGISKEFFDEIKGSELLIYER